MTTGEKPSAEATRAAKQIDAKVLRFETGEIESRPVEWLAEIIDAEHRELRKCLRDCYEMFLGPHASGSFTCGCGNCGPCEMRKRAERLLKGER